ncbi:unnamed protein product [Adineta steineri]|uniref:Uncharacterized protein n=1 Tax=Adineta steineri TaxID=433720 RepID=A0A814L937_9BILA|nr:unnamed protein product [Adineta steineri]CAF1160286.1 unnamed protein product [Adineta steineri]
MPPRSSLLLIGIFGISFALHIFLQHKIAQCHRSRKQHFYSGWFAAGWPYAVAHCLITYGLPQLLILFGFGPLGIIRHSIASWIQSVWGASIVFSFLQSIGARGGISNRFLKLLGIARIIEKIRSWFWDDDYIAQCVNYYEWWSTVLSIIELVVCFIIYWLLRRRR